MSLVAGLGGTMVAVWLALVAPPPVPGADVVPPAPLPEKGSGPKPGITPETPSESGLPPIPPSKIDPGIQQRPSTIPDPRSAVPPPNVDPNMSRDPEAAPPADSAKKPQRRENPRTR